MSNNKNPNILIGVFFAIIFYIFLGIGVILNESFKRDNIIEKGCPGFSKKSNEEICKMFKYNKYDRKTDECIKIEKNNSENVSYDFIFKKGENDCYGKGKNIEESIKINKYKGI